jgi:hypothetical protein
MPRFITAIAILFLTLTVQKTLAVPLNEPLRKTYGGLSSMALHEPTNTVDDDRPNRSQSLDTGNTTTEANALLDLRLNLLRHDNVTPMSGTTKTDAANNVETQSIGNQDGYIESNK